jgi:putative ABC transport system ATP-binding protein
MEASNAVIKLVKVYKIYTMGRQEIRAVNNVSLSVNSGEFISIMGPSGSGKTTLLNLIGCLDRPTKGKVFLDGVNVSSLNDIALTGIRRDKIGFVFQQFNLIPTLNAIENVELPMIFKGIEKQKREMRAKKLLELVGMEDKAAHRPAEMSGGEQQRIAIARALANNPAIILADEPTGNLDSKTGRDIMELLKDLNMKGRTIIVVTHDPVVAEYSERIIRIKDGKLDVS